ncbi:MAG TPA: inorganic phosphate transporter [Tepidisphaeraceae bacterium]|jgi:PiT family inorganic phosphate transporter
MLAALVVLVALLAFANGANDNSKGVATLVGYGAAKPRQALIWAMISTAIGAIVSFWFAPGLLKSFSGGGLFSQGAQFTNAFWVCVLIGAFGWVIFATFTGMPVSTTHAIMGALVGAGLLTFGRQSFEWSVLGMKFAMPLALSPVLSLAVVYLISWPVGMILARIATRCVCVAPTTAVPVWALTVSGIPLANAPMAAVVVGSESECAAAGATTVASTSAAANAVHWLSSGMVGFARGWNDAPKIAGLAIAALGGTRSFAIVTVAMAIGGLVAGKKVLETLSKKVTAMPLAESLTASIVTATLVSLASWKALPVSTTHVSTGAIVGAGLKNDPNAVKWGKVGEIVLSWIITLPAAALLAAAARLLIH